MVLPIVTVAEYDSAEVSEYNPAMRILVPLLALLVLTACTESTTKIPVISTAMIAQLPTESPLPVPTATAVPLSSEVLDPTATPAPTSTTVPFPTATAPPSPTVNLQATATVEAFRARQEAFPTPVPTPTATPLPTATSTAVVPTPTPLPLPTATPEPPLTIETLFDYALELPLPVKYDFIGDGVTTDEQAVIDHLRNLYSIETFWESTRGPGNSVDLLGALPTGMTKNELMTKVLHARLIMNNYGFDWKLNGDADYTNELGERMLSADFFHQVMDDLGIYPGDCERCYGKVFEQIVDGIDFGFFRYADAATTEGNNLRYHVWYFGYLAEADGRGITFQRIVTTSLDEWERKARQDPFVAKENATLGQNNVRFWDTTNTGETFITTINRITGGIGRNRNEMDVFIGVIAFGKTNWVHANRNNRFSSYSTCSPQRLENPPPGCVAIVGKITSQNVYSVLASVADAIGTEGSTVGAVTECIGGPGDSSDHALLYIDGMPFIIDGNWVQLGLPCGLLPWPRT